MNLYEFNQMAYSKVPAMKDNVVQTIIKDYLEKYPSQFYLMLNHDIHYYTVFHVEDKENVILNKQVFIIWKLIHDLGEIVDVIINDDNNMLEIWIRQEDGKVLMFGFFDYTRGVVEL